jgi:hypothetical protein
MWELVPVLLITWTLLIFFLIRSMTHLTGDDFSTLGVNILSLNFCFKIILETVE